MSAVPGMLRGAKRYLGDGVYVEYDGRLGLVLTTEDGLQTTNRIVLEDEVYSALLEYVRALTVARECPRCAGCGRIANDDDGTPWKYWAELPLENAISVVAGIVQPQTCPACNGSGRAA